MALLLGQRWLVQHTTGSIKHLLFDACVDSRFFVISNPDEVSELLPHSWRRIMRSKTLLVTIVISSVIASALTTALSVGGIPVVAAKTEPQFNRQSILAGAPRAQVNSSSESVLYLPFVRKGFPPQCYPGQTSTDPAGDTPLAYIDVLWLSSTLTGQTLSAWLRIQDVPSALVFNRVGVPQYDAEYEWLVIIDVDGDPATGDPNYFRGGEYLMSAMHIVQTPNSPVTLPISNGAEKQKVWKLRSGGGYEEYAAATLTVDPSADTMALSGNIPGIHAGSRVFFFTRAYDNMLVRRLDRSSCDVTPGILSPAGAPGIAQETKGGPHWWALSPDHSR